jgi:Prp31 C terminal domain
MSIHLPCVLYLWLMSYTPHTLFSTHPHISFHPAASLLIALRLPLGAAHHVLTQTGRKFKTEMEAKIEKWQEPPPAKTVKPLPCPDGEAKKRRGGRRLRKMKERYGLTDVRHYRHAPALVLCIACSLLCTHSCDLDVSTLPAMRNQPAVICGLPLSVCWCCISVLPASCVPPSDPHCLLTTSYAQPHTITTTTSTNMATSTT